MPWWRCSDPRTGVTRKVWSDNKFDPRPPCRLGEAGEMDPFGGPPPTVPFPPIIPPIVPPDIPPNQPPNLPPVYPPAQPALPKLSPTPDCPGRFDSGTSWGMVFEVVGNVAVQSPPCVYVGGVYKASDRISNVGFYTPSGNWCCISIHTTDCQDTTRQSGFDHGPIGVCYQCSADCKLPSSQPPPTIPPPTTPPCSFCNTPVTSGTYDKCCQDKLQPDLHSIANSLEEIVKLLGKKLGDDCSVSDKCLDELAEKVAQKLAKDRTTCEKCCQKLRDNIGLTFAESLQCANCDCDAAICEATCSDPTILSPGTCVFAGETWDKSNNPACETKPTPKEVKHIGWYSCTTREVVALSVDETPPNSTYQSVGQFDTRGEAYSAAENAMLDFCRQQDLPPLLPARQLPRGGGAVCDVHQYGDEAARNSYISTYDELVLASTGTTIIQSIFTALTAATQQIPGLSGLSPGIQASLAGQVAMSSVLSPIIADVSGCSDKFSKNAINALANVSYLSQQAGFDFGDFVMPLVYAAHAGCRNIQLSPDQAIAGWLANELSDKDLDTHWAIAGFCEPSVNITKQASRSKPVPQEIITLLNRDVIDLEQAHEKLRQLGYIEAETRQQLIGLGQQVPPYSDIVRMMVRDSADETIASWPEADQEFLEKYQGKLKYWAKAQGIPDEVFKFIWRAHYSIPSPGQLFEMYHRLRYDPQYGGPDKFLERIKGALEQQDIAPDWRDPLLAISFNPLTRIDTRRAYQIGSIDDNELSQSYRNQGYSDENVAILVKFTKRLKDVSARDDHAIKQWLEFGIDGETCRNSMRGRGYTDSQIDNAMSARSIRFVASEQAKMFKAGDLSRDDSIAELHAHGVRTDDARRVLDKLSGLVTYHLAVDEYSVGIVSRAKAEKDMADYGIDAKRIDRLLTKVDSRLGLTSAQACATAVRRQYLYGAVNDKDAKTLLANQGMDETRANFFVTKWQCELAARGQQPSINMLCKWLTDGTINPRDYMDRAIRLGYSEDDASNILINCMGRINATRAKQAIAEAKAEAAAIEKADRRAKQETAAIEKERAKMAKARKARAETRNRREALTLKAADKIIAACNCDVFTSVNAARDIIVRLESQYQLDIDRALQVLITATEAWSSGELSDLNSIADTFATDLLASIGLDTEITDSHPEISNGFTQLG